jgi:type II secretory pathway component PulF
MPLYVYEAADQSGNKVKDTLEAAAESGVKEYLSEQGLLPLSIKEAGKGRGILISRVSRKDLLDFTQELSNLLESGMPIDKAVYALSVYSGSPAMRSVLQQVYADLQRGQSLSQALTRHREFSALYVNMIKAGEAGGALEGSVARLGEFLEASVAFREEVRSAIVYPVFLTIITSLAVAFLMIYVVPQFMKMIEGAGQEPPLSMMALVRFSGFMGAYWWALLAGAGAAVFGLDRYIRTPEGRRLFDTVKLRLPLVGALHSKTLTARFARTLGTLLQSGVPILEAIKVSREVIGNSVVSGRLDSLVEGVSKGRGVSAPLRESRAFPPIVVQVVSVGEDAGRLDNAFMKVADRFEAESRRTIKRLMSVLPTMLIVLMAVAVGFIVYSLLMTVLSINDIPF